MSHVLSYMYINLFTFVHQQVLGARGDLGGGGGVLPHSSYMGVCCPTRLCFWDSDLHVEQGIIFKPFSRMGRNITNA